MNNLYTATHNQIEASQHSFSQHLLLTISIQASFPEFPLQKGSQSQTAWVPRLQQDFHFGAEGGPSLGALMGGLLRCHILCSL
jgi:hypothetical protein